jgi:hypothetical protein
MEPVAMTAPLAWLLVKDFISAICIVIFVCGSFYALNLAAAAMQAAGWLQ